ncbi:MAG: G8 domain-containing protein [Gemmatimonadetes bacterium]|nr:G8 domain-containing protein [Gemmatimonadota bacterium]
MSPRRLLPRCLALVFAAAGCAGDGSTGLIASNGPGALGGELRVRRWSDARAWPLGRIPAAGDTVVVPAGTLMRLDVSPPALAGLDIQGVVEFERDMDLSLSTGFIRIEGALRIGTLQAPYTKRATITLTGPTAGDAIPGMGTRVIGVFPGGELTLIGETRTAWTRLNASAPSGARTLTMRDDIDWRAGDRIVIAPSGFEPTQAEQRRISAVSGRTVTLETGLQHPHYGDLQLIAGRTVDERAEVGLLTRNIRIQGAGTGIIDGVPQSADGIGGHIMILAGATASVLGVELANMGQRGKLGHYPIHWHLAGAVPQQFIRNSAIWRSNNRCVTVHGTRQLEVRDNVCYDHLGHGYFLEDGGETQNALHHNLGVLSRRPAVADRLLPSDDRPATFWVTNPDNSLIGNVAAGSDAFGFWYALPDNPRGFSAGQPDRPNRTPLLAFTNNVAHSNRQTGLHVDDGPLADGTTVGTSYQPRAVPSQVGSATVPAYFMGFTAYKNSGRGVWLRGRDHFLSGAVLADNGIGATFASAMSYLTSSLVVGRTANLVTSRDLYRGFEFYDGPVGARDVTFAGFSGNGLIPWSALGFNRNGGGGNAFALSTLNSAHNLTFVESNALYIDTPVPTKDGDKTAVFEDLTGSLTGTAGRWVTANTPFLTTADCMLRGAWNAQICPGPYLRAIVEGSGTAAPIAPVDIVRDGTASERFVGSGTSTSRVIFAAMPSRRYDLTLRQFPTTLTLRLQEARAGEWLLFSVGLPGRPVSVLSGSTAVPEVATPALVGAGSTMALAWDASQQRLHVKVLVPTSSTQGLVTIRVRP